MRAICLVALSPHIDSGRLMGRQLPADVCPQAMCGNRCKLIAHLLIAHLLLGEGLEGDIN